MGKYDDDIKNNMLSFVALQQINLKELNKIIQKNFENVKNYYTQSIPLNRAIQMLKQIKESDNYLKTIEIQIAELSNKRITTEKEIDKSIYTIGCATLTAIILLTEQNEDNIKHQAYSLYERKNASYNDVWYARGIEGVCVDINRKTSRLDAIITNKSRSIDGETLIDTLIDTFVFSAFLVTAFQKFK